MVSLHCHRTLTETTGVQYIQVCAAEEWIKKIPWGRGGDSAGEGICLQGWHLEFDTQDTHGRRGETTLVALRPPHVPMCTVSLGTHTSSRGVSGWEQKDRERLNKPHKTKQKDKYKLHSEIVSALKDKGKIDATWDSCCISPHLNKDHISSSWEEVKQAGAWGNWSRSLWQVPARDERWCSACFSLIIQFRAPARGMVPPTAETGLLTLICLLWAISHRRVQRLVS